MEKIFNKKNTIIFVGILTLWRLYLASTLQLHPDEAYYWLWSRHLDLSYFDHPPMVAYFIRLTTLLSCSELWIRFSGIIVSIILSFFTWRFSKQLFTKDLIASCNVILINIYPITMAGSIIITPDIPSFLFWTLSIYFCWQIFVTKEKKYWYILGIAFGLSLLSKYTVVLLVPIIFLYLLLTEERYWFKTVYPYLSALIALLVFSPVILWNIKHNWISFGFQIGHGLGGSSYDIGNILEYIGSQMLIIGPLAWLAGIFIIILYLYKKEFYKKERFFLILTSVFIILFFLFTSLKKPGEANWPILAYFTFTFLITDYLINGNNLKKALWILIVLTNLSLSFLVTLHAKFNILPLDRISRKIAKIDATNWFYGWRELSKRINEFEDVEFIMTRSHQLNAEIAYYLKEKIPVVMDTKLSRLSQFTIWSNLYNSEGKNGVYVSYNDKSNVQVKEKFRNYKKLDPLTVYRKDIPIRTYYFVYSSRGVSPKNK